MAGRLVTIATFDLPAKARLAQNILESAGIKAAVADETTVAMDWLLGAAIGWVKVQVMEEDAERAVAALEEALGGGDEPVDEEALAAEAEAAGIEEGSAAPEPLVPRPAATPPPDLPAPRAADPHPGDEADPPPSERDQYARRLFLASFFGLIIPLLWFYAVYLFFNAAFGPGSLGPRGKFNLFVGGLFVALGSVMAFFLLRIYGDPFP